MRAPKEIKQLRTWGAALMVFIAAGCGASKSGVEYDDSFEQPPTSVPVVSAGSNQSVKLPVSIIQLEGSGFDPKGKKVEPNWSLVDGPNVPTIENPKSFKTRVLNIVAGVYVFKLEVASHGGGRSHSNLTVVVTRSTDNAPPVASAGPDQTITLPLNTVVIRGNGTDQDGIISRYSWDQVSGPTRARLTDVTSDTLLATSLAEGTYIFRVTVTDNEGAPASATTNITVLPAIPGSTNILPTVSAGDDQVLEWPADSVLLVSFAEDVDGNIVSYQWEQVSGPSGFVMSNPFNSRLAVSNMWPGTYRFQVRVTDNSGGIATDKIWVTVRPMPGG